MTDEESDELLNDILSSLGGTSSEPTASANALARHRPAAPPSQGFSRVPNTISRCMPPSSFAIVPKPRSSQAAYAVSRCRPVMPAASVRPRASAVQGSSGKATISRTANYSRPAPTGLGIRSTSNRQHAASPEANAGEPAFDDFEFDTPAVPAPEDNEDADMPPATEAARELDMSAGDIETPGEADGAQDQEDMRAMLEDAAVEEEEDQEHPKAVKSRQIGKGAIVEEDGTAQAAAGWAELCNAEPGGDGWDDEAAAAAEDERKEDVAMASLDEAEEMPFFLLDIHEEYTQPGVPRALPVHPDIEPDGLQREGAVPFTERSTTAGH